MKTSAPFFRARVLNAVRVLLGVGVLWGLERSCFALLQLCGLKFPSSVAGMLAAFAVMLGLRSVAPLGAEWFAHALAPARLFLTRWMALFFVPPLVQLPLNALPGVSDLLACVLIVAGGFCANLIVTAWVASRGKTTTLPVKPQKANENAWTRRLLLSTWGGLTLVSGVAWLVGQTEGLRGFGIGVAVLGFVFAEMWREWLTRHEFDGAALVFHPVVMSACFAGVAWTIVGQPLSNYLYHGASAPFVAPGNWLMALLAPAVVALGLVLDTERVLLRANLRPLLAGTSCGALFSMLSSAVLSRLLDVSDLYARALLPRAVTTPVALVIAQMFGGNPGLTAGFVVMSGVLGALFAAPILERLGFRAAFVQGVATGVSSHGIGTAALVRDNPRAAAFSAIAFALTAAMSVGVASIAPMRAVIDWVLGH